MSFIVLSVYRKAKRLVYNSKYHKEVLTEMSTKAWIIFAAVCVVLFGGLIIWSSRDKIDVSKVDTNKIQSASKNSGNIADHVFGNKDSKVVLFEYGDFQCPGCGGAHPTVKTVTQKYEEQMGFVFRNFPLTTIHPNARAAAAAVEAAGLNGKYWQMHNLVFESQNDWSDASASQRTTLFTQYAVTAGVDADTFTKTLTDKSPQINRKIDFDRALGGKIGVNSTPTFYLNGKKLESDQYNSEEALEKTLLEAFKDAGISVPADETKS